jgi:hypothetical protein
MLWCKGRASRHLHVSALHLRSGLRRATLMDKEEEDTEDTEDTEEREGTEDTEDTEERDGG